MNNYSERDQEVLQLMYATAANFPYNPPSYTCIREFTDSFPKNTTSKFKSEPPRIKSEWKLEPPYPRIYTKDYKKTILATPI